MAFSKIFILFFAVVAAALQPSEARVQFKPAAANQEASEPAIAGNQEVPEPSSKAAAADGGLVQPSTLPQIPGFPPLSGVLPFLPLLPFPGFPPLPGLPLPPLPGLPLPPFPGTPGAPHLPPTAGSPGSPNAPPSQSLPGLPTLPPLVGLPSLPGSLSPPPQPAECLTPLMGLMPCMDYLTNTSVLTPPSTCCDGFKSLVSDAPICLCHGMNGDMNRLLPKPIDPIRMMLLPLTCGTLPPIQTFFMCSTQTVPPLIPPSPSSPAPASPPVSPSSGNLFTNVA